MKDDPNNISSHDVIIGEVFLPGVEEDAPKAFESASYSQLILNKPKWNESGMSEYQSQTARVLQELSEEYDKVEYIPALCEMISKTLVISAENNFETTKPNNKAMKKFPYFSKEYREAHRDHKKVCEEWRREGRPPESSHPAKSAVSSSRRQLQKIRRDEESLHSINTHNDLMKTFDEDVNKVYSKLKKARGENIRNTEIPFIETLAGKYTNENVLEGFCANTEILCNGELGETNGYDNDFYKMAIKENMIIFDITADANINIPQMKLSDLKDILFKKLKLNKACDVFKLTVEHLRFAGDESLLIILKLLNAIIQNINILSCAQLNTSVASVVYKGKNKPIFHHKSHRLVRVTPLIGRLIDEYMRPALVEIVRPVQNSNQYGFTEGVSYLMGAVQRHEVEKHCINMKKTFLLCSLDGDSAFEVVNRQI